MRNSSKTLCFPHYPFSNDFLFFWDNKRQKKGRKNRQKNWHEKKMVFSHESEGIQVDRISREKNGFQSKNRNISWQMERTLWNAWKIFDIRSFSFEQQYILFGFWNYLPERIGGKEAVIFVFCLIDEMTSHFLFFLIRQRVKGENEKLDKLWWKQEYFVKNNSYKIGKNGNNDDTSLVRNSEGEKNFIVETFQKV